MPHAPGISSSVSMLDRSDIKKLVQDRLQSIGAASEHDIAIIGPLRINRYSKLFRLEVTGAPKSLAIKCIVDPATGYADRLTARNQYSALERLHRIMGSDSVFRVPEPFLLLESEGIIAIEWVAGTPMTQRFFSPSLTLRQARDLMQQAAGWLRHFAIANQQAIAPIFVEDKVAGLAAIEAGALGRYRSARAALAALRQHATEVNAQPLRHGWLHGDFKMDNLLVDGATIVGLDVHALHENAVVHDLASFLNHWELTALDPRAWRWRSRRFELGNAFLESYGDDYVGRNKLPYLWIALHGMLGTWEEFTERQRLSVQHFYLRACFELAVRRMTRDLHAAARW